MNTLNTINYKGDTDSKTAILLCTFNGEKHLRELLTSINNQTHTNYDIHISDDSSKDQTIEIVKEYQAKSTARQIYLYTGPAQGFSANFLSLVYNPDIKAKYYAYADQDDIWEPCKIERAINVLKNIPSHIPALYCGRTTIVDVANKEIGVSPLFSKQPCFSNALMQNIGGGNTMVFNHAARKLLAMTKDINVPHHDWWTYLVVAGCGGIVFYDSHPTLRYRQHDQNLMGMNTSWPARLKRLKLLKNGNFRDWNDFNLEALEKIKNNLTTENRRTLELFKKGRQMHILSRQIYLKRSGIHRQTLAGNLALIIAALFNKL